MIPTRVGVNRHRGVERDVHGSDPHACGGEPVAEIKAFFAQM